MDKMLEYENIIQAFSRTNRLFGHEKKFGTIRYYRKPHTMERKINEAVKLYSGDKPVGLFVQKLKYNLKKLNSIYADIYELFKNAGIENFAKLPDEKADRGKFVSLFSELDDYLEAAQIQGFKWDKPFYNFTDDYSGEKFIINLAFDENTYLVLVLRYKELFIPVVNPSGGNDDIPFDITTHITEIDTGKIDADYMNSNFVKYLKLIKQDDSSHEALENTRNELHKNFARLTQEEQKYANIFLHEVESGDVVVEEGKTLRDYITEYQHRAKNDQIHCYSEALGLDEAMLRSLLILGLNEININENSRLDVLKDTVDKTKARVYFEKKYGVKLKPFQVNVKIDEFLRKFIISGGVELE